jgi:hypothetical protein
MKYIQQDMHGNPWYICSYCARESGEEKRRKIEAYDALAKENEELKLAFQSLQSGFDLDKLEKEINQLKKECADAYANGYGDQSIDLQRAEAYGDQRDEEITSLRESLKVAIECLDKYPEHGAAALCVNHVEFDKQTKLLGEWQEQSMKLREALEWSSDEICQHKDGLDPLREYPNMHRAFCSCSSWVYRDENYDKARIALSSFDEFINKQKEKKWKT